MTNEAAPKKKATYKRPPVYDMPRPGAEQSGRTALYLQLRRLEEVKELLWIPKGTPEELAAARVIQALDLYQEIAPQTGLEGMLALQMVGTHSAAMECLKRAALPDQTFEGREMALKYAHKLMTLYTQQLAALDKHRGKGQQKLIVEHVKVEIGNQSAVENLRQPAKALPSPRLALEDARTLRVGLDTERETEPRSGRRKT